MKVPRKSIFSVLVLAIVSWCLISHAIDREAIFHRYDKDGDKVVTAEELPDAATRARFDKNGDGNVSLEEFQKTVGIATSKEENDRLAKLVRYADKNKDGKLTKEEVGGGARWFNRVDQDKNGEIDSAELETVRQLISRLGEVILPTIPETDITEEELKEITSGPEILKPGDVGIGRMIPDVEFTDLDGKAHRLSDLSTGKGTVVAMTSATCPVSKRFLPTLASLEQELNEKGISLLLVNPYSSESEEEVRKQLSAHSFQAPYVRDTGKQLTAALGAATTTEVFFFDSKRTLHYRGALNDQYGIDYSVNEARHHYLLDAVAAHLKNETPEIQATAAPGCELETGSASEALTKTDVTYHKDVARILQQNCVRCHYDGGIAPFALDDYDEVSDRTRVIKRVVSEGTMPPWFAAPQEDGGASPWANDHSLSERDRTDLLAWLESSDKPIGNPADAPEPLVFSDEWSIGEPDLVFQLSKAYDIKATGFMPYQYDTIETNLTEDKWIKAYEILPSERDVVHHVLVQVFEQGAKIREQGEGSTGYWAAYVPGNGEHVFPDGFAKKIPAGAKLQFQIHYTPSGEAKKERLKIGLVFADEAPKYELRTLPLADRKLEIPPGAEAHVEGASRKINNDVPIVSFMPHMHVRGAAFKYEVEYPGGETETLLDIPRYDFNWQLRYDLKQPKIIPKGSTIRVTGVFDNSSNNKANPDPTKTVGWGSQTVDEMLIGYIEYMVPVIEAGLASTR